MVFLQRLGPQWSRRSRPRAPKLKSTVLMPFPLSTWYTPKSCREMRVRASTEVRPNELAGK